MLILTRSQNESIIIDGDIRITVISDRHANRIGEYLWTGSYRTSCSICSPKRSHRPSRKLAQTRSIFTLSHLPVGGRSITAQVR